MYVNRVISKEARSNFTEAAYDTGPRRVGGDFGHNQSISADDIHHIPIQAPTTCVLYATVDRINSESLAERALSRTQVHRL